ncbi:TauD/TfdA family dioxygenase [Leptolyngbyaceae cyanobacterium UHCC 1019]
MNYQHLIEKFSSKQEAGFWIRNYVNTYGFLLIEDFQIAFLDVEKPKQLLDFSSYIGSPVAHNLGMKDFVWEIGLKPNSSLIKTFSEHSMTAPLHTDSQYRDKPEKYMVLLAVKQAKCGGGETHLVDFKQVLQDMKSSKEGKGVLKFISENQFPIAVPSVFKKDCQESYIMSRLISDNPFIRYRYDILKTGISLIKTNNSHEFHKNLELFNRFIQNSSHRLGFQLLKNSLLIVDNHRILHGRSCFWDSERLLLRVRLN